ncbi:Uncharacterised protein [Raoultella terrigena]|uniref:Uncharacterized protein n=1 Tax=Raoultella terrigena TaxID=577 RepID=A0A3P8JRU4_RAOTE|nr:Uncharacterised protein [Raoultella terrigena]
MIPCSAKAIRFLPFEIEGFSHNRNGQDTKILRHFCDHWCRTGTGTAAIPAAINTMSAAVESSTQRFTVFIRRIAADFRVGARAQTFGNTATNLNSLANGRFTQRLRVGVHREEFHTLDALAHHVLYGITAAATDADDFNHRVVG